MGIIVCQYSFEHPDPKDSSIALHEVDFYAWIPYNFHKKNPNHRLSLRFRFQTQKFEIYRRFSQPIRLVNKEHNYLIETTKDLGTEKVIYETEDLAEALSFANGEYQRFHGKRQGDKVCQHKYPDLASFCGKQEG